MAIIKDYASLTQAIADWTHNSLLTSGSTPYSDYFIQAAQQAIENDLPDLNFGNCIALQEAPYGPVPIQGGFAPFPTDFLAPKLFTVADGLGDVCTLAFKAAAWIYDPMNYPVRQAAGIPAFIARDTATQLLTDEFTAGSGQTLFSLSWTPTASPLVSLDGSILYPGTDYTLTGNILSLTSGALEGQTLGVSYISITSTQAFTATSGQTVFTVTGTPSVVALDGAMLAPGVDYSVSGTTLTLVRGALADQTLACFYGSRLQVQTGVASGATFSGPALPVGLVSVDGAVWYPNMDYTVSAGVITFTELPDDGANIVALYQTGDPGSVFIFGPYPDSNYTVQGTYYASAPLLSSSQTTNWMVESAPDVILAACMREAGKFLQDMSMTQQWDAVYQQKLKALVDRDKASRWAASTLQIDVG